MSDQSNIHLQVAPIEPFTIRIKTASKASVFVWLLFLILLVTNKEKGAPLQSPSL